MPPKNLLMGQRGVFLTLSVFLLSLAILFYNSSVYETQVAHENQPELLALREAGEKCRDIERALVDLDLSGEKKSDSERGLPFSYSGSANSVSFSQFFPVFPRSLSSYYDSLNGFRIFFLRQATQSLSPEFALDINTARDANWGGNDSTAHFLVLPYCAEYSLSADTVFFGQSHSNQCQNPFDSSSLRRADLNVVMLDLREDFNSVRCNNGACPQDPYNPANPNPYFKIDFSAEGCPDCRIPQQTVSAHFPVGADYNVFLSCAGPCDSEPIQIVFNKWVTISRNSAKSVRLTMDFQFDENITAFKALDINYSIRVPKYGIVRTNNPNAVPA